MADTKEGAERAKRKEERKQKQAARAEKRADKTTAGERPERLCMLATVEVKKKRGGFQVIINGSEGRNRIDIAMPEVNQVLRDLETAFYVIRASIG